jgi:hypothetical protein
MFCTAKGGNPMGGMKNRDRLVGRQKQEFDINDNSYNVTWKVADQISRSLNLDYSRMARKAQIGAHHIDGQRGFPALFRNLQISCDVSNEGKDSICLDVHINDIREDASVNGCTESRWRQVILLHEQPCR